MHERYNGVHCENSNDLSARRVLKYRGFDLLHLLMRLVASYGSTMSARCIVTRCSYQA